MQAKITLTVVDSHFEKCSAEEGGAIKLEN